MYMPLSPRPNIYPTHRGNNISSHPPPLSLSRAPLALARQRPCALAPRPPPRRTVPGPSLVDRGRPLSTMPCGPHLSVASCTSWTPPLSFLLHQQLAQLIGAIDAYKQQSHARTHRHADHSLPYYEPHVHLLASSFGRLIARTPCRQADHDHTVLPWHQLRRARHRPSTATRHRTSAVPRPAKAAATRRAASSPVRSTIAQSSSTPSYIYKRRHQAH